MHFETVLLIIEHSSLLPGLNIFSITFIFSYNSIRECAVIATLREIACGAPDKGIR